MVVILTVSLKQVLLHKNVVFGTIHPFQKCFRFLSVALIKPSKGKLKLKTPVPRPLIRESKAGTRRKADLLTVPHCPVSDRGSHLIEENIGNVNLLLVI